MKPHALALEPLTFAELSGRAVMELAHEAGFEYASLNLYRPHTGEYDPLVTDGGLRRETAAWAREAGLGVQTVEAFNLLPGIDPAIFEPAIRAGHELGARTATAIVWENGDKAEAAAAFRALCGMAQGTGIRVNIEFFAACRTITTLGDALDFLDMAGCAEAGVVLDTLHIMRTAGGFSGLQALDPALVGGAQINDGLVPFPGDLLHEAGLDRLAPGEGDFALREFAAWLPRHIVLGVEVPSPQRAAAGSDLAFARHIRAAALGVYG